MATLIFSQGVPMILGGDELSHTQQGNNNAYCHDDELTWLNWDLGPAEKHFLEFVKTCTRIWREQPVLQRRHFFQGRPIRGSGVKDLTFFEPSGKEMSDEAWSQPGMHCLGLRLAGDMIQEVDARGHPLHGDTLMVLLNAGTTDEEFLLPAPRSEKVWERLIDTAHPDVPHTVHPGDESYTLKARSMAVLRTSTPEVAAAGYSQMQVEMLRRETEHVEEPPLVQ
jgi:glycogen operon protein